MKNSFFYLSDIPGSENSFSVKWKRSFNEFFIPASRNRKSIFLFRALVKLLKFEGGNSCFWKLIFWLVELIFSHFSDTPSSEAILRLVETYFQANPPIRIVEKHFLFCGNRFLLFNLFFYKWKLSLKLMETLFWGKRLYFR